MRRSRESPQNAARVVALRTGIVGHDLELLAAQIRRLEASVEVVAPRLCPTIGAIPTIPAKICHRPIQSSRQMSIIGQSRRVVVRRNGLACTEDPQPSFATQGMIETVGPKLERP